MTGTRSSFRAVGALLLTLLFTLLMVTVPRESDPQALGISNTSITLAVGKTKTLSISGAYDDVTWKSSNKNIASVNKYGKVTARKVGTAFVTATVDGMRLQCTVKVVPGTITSSSNNVSVSAGSSKVVTITAKGSHAVRVKSSNTAVATAGWVNSYFTNDKVQLRIRGKRAGSATIKVYMSKYSSVYTNIYVNVTGNSSNYSSMPSISTSQSTVNVNANGSATFTVYSSQGNNVRMTLSNSNVASVSVGGWYNNSATVTVRGKRAGTATLTIKSRSNSNVYRTVTINVDGGSNLSASTQNVNVRAGSTYDLTLYSSNPSYLSYQNSNSNVADYNVISTSSTQAKVRITGRQSGTSYLTVTDRTSNRTVRININVSGTKLSTSVSTLNVKAGSQSSFTITADNVNNLIYSVSNSNIASYYFNNAGSNKVNMYVTGNQAGTTYLTIKDTYSNTSVTVTIKVTGSSLTVSPGNLNLTVGNTGNITVTASNSNNIDFYSSNTTVATCWLASQNTNKAVITVNANMQGSAVIYVTDRSTNTTQKVNVNVTNGNITVSPTSVSIKVGGTADVTVNNVSDLGFSIGDWNIADANRVSTGSNSVVIRITGKQAGRTTLNVTDAKTGKSANVSVTVTGGTMNVSPTNVTMKLGDTKTVTITGTDNIDYRCSDENIVFTNPGFYGNNTVTLSLTGRSSGSVTIYITDLNTGVSKTVYATVQDNNKPLIVSTSYLSISAFDSQTFTLTCTDASRVNVSSSNSSVASVSTNPAGQSMTVYVYANSVGQANINIYDPVTQVSATVTVNVSGIYSNDYNQWQ